MKHLYTALLTTLSLLGGCSTTMVGTNLATATVETQAAPTATSIAPVGVPAPAAQPARTARPAPGAQQATSGARALEPLAPLSANQAQSLSVALLTPPVDLWERIRRGFAMPDLDSDLVRDREQWYATRPDYLQRMSERGRKYMFHIVEELERRNMPTELALLPFIESAFNPQAVSSAKAAGMWQFMPATGKTFELKQNAFRDDRRDVLASTRAALDYLQKLHGMFGDWHLALAAYNWGEGSVGRAIAKNRKLNLGTGYQDLSMPAETRLYVPKLQAVKNIVAAPQNFATSLPVIENHPYFQTVTITRDIDVELAAKLAQVQIDDFKALNPSLSRPVILAAGTPQILLPWDNAATFESNLQAQGPAQLATWTAWQAPSTLKPAEAAKRVGMSEQDLRVINKIPSGVMIKAGSTLLVSRTAAHSQDVAEHVADNAQLTLSPLPVLARQTIRAAKGDSVASVAQRYKVPAASVAEWNRVAAAATFKAGQSLTLYLPARARTAVAGSAPAKGKKAARGKSRPVQLARR